MNECSCKCNRLKCGIIPAFLIHLCVGSLYCWPYLDEFITRCVGKFASDLGFSLALLFIGVSSLISRYLVVNIGFRSVVLVSSISYGLGLVLSGLALNLEAAWLFVIGYGVLSGIGIGLGYMAPIKNLMLWYKGHLGLVTGISIFAFGLSKFILTPIFSWMIPGIGVGKTMIIFGVISFLIMFLGYILIHRPIYWRPVLRGWSDFVRDLESTWKSRNFQRYWAVFFLITLVGVIFMYNEKLIFSISTVFGGAVGVTMGMMVGSMFNSLGRLVFPGISDYMNRRYLLIIMISLGILACLVGFNYSLLPITVFIIYSIYGGIFATIPSILADRYGVEEVSETHGLILTGWAVAGLIAPSISSRLTSSFGVSGLILVSTILLVVALGYCLSIERRK